MTSDPRMTPANERVAHTSLRGEVRSGRFLDGKILHVQQPIANLSSEPGGPRTSQLVFGEAFCMLEEVDGHAFGRCERDGYVGWVARAALSDGPGPTHWVVAPATHLYPQPNIKSEAQIALFFGSGLHVTGEKGSFLQVATGHFVPKQHVMPLKARYDDPLGVADLFLGTPYLWGGTSRWGIDCSGLVQIALLACGVACPRDSDQQAEAVGEDLLEAEPLRRGDLVFWTGHVGFMSDSRTLLHANVHHMSVAYEPLKDAAARIASAGDGHITRRKRVKIDAAIPQPE